MGDPAGRAGDREYRLPGPGPRIGYLLKARVSEVDGFLEALERILSGGSIVEQSLVRELATRRDRLDRLSPRERDVLELMAAGRSNAGIARRLGLEKATVERYVHSILVNLVPPETADHRRVRAVLTYLEVSVREKHGAKRDVTTLKRFPGHTRRRSVQEVQ